MSRCILWAGGMGSDGYGHARIGGRVMTAHRAAWEKVNGPVPQGMHVHHECGVRLCVNVDHLRLLTHREHSLLHNPRPTHCKRGHEFTPENTYTYERTGYRACRTCQREQQRRRNAQKKRG